MSQQFLPWNSAWIIGGSTGMGAEVVKQLDARGVRVIASARGEKDLTDLCDGRKNASPLPLDITDKDAVVAAVDTVRNQLGDLPDLILLNAAVYAPMDASTFDAKAIQSMVAVNYMGLVNCFAALLPFKDKGEKPVTIASVSSPSGWRGLPGGVGYGPTKAAVINLVEGLKPELDATRFDVRLVNPGFIRTRLTDMNDFDMPQLMEAEDAAARLIKGVAKGKFDSAFPYPFVGVLKFLRLLPYWLYFAITRRMR